VFSLNYFINIRSGAEAKTFDAKYSEKVRGQDQVAETGLPPGQGI